MGSETQGSIIAPAGVNSVVALKTSRGLVSRDYVIPLLPWQDVPGPMGRTVTDVAVLLSAMTGVDDNDPETAKAADLAGTDFSQFLTPDALDGLRVGVPIWNEEAFTQYFEENEVADAEQQQNLKDAFAPQIEESRARIDALTAAGVSVVEIPATATPSFGLVDVRPALEFGYKDAINAFLASLGDDAPVRSLEEIIAFNKEDLASRAPYGQDHLEASQNTEITAEEYEELQQGNQAMAQEALDELFEQHAIDVIASEVAQLYAPAGYPALTVPSGYDEDGTPQGTVFVGRYLSEPQLLAVGFAFEQAIQARVAPDVEETLKLIESLPSEESVN